MEERRSDQFKALRKEMGIAVAAHPEPCKKIIRELKKCGYDVTKVVM